MVQILEGIGNVITSVMGWIVSLFSGVTELFYNAETGFSFLGVILLVAFGLSMVWVVIQFIKSLVKRG